MKVDLVFNGGQVRLVTPLLPESGCSKPYDD
jgi:hypothetical protein